MSRDDSHDARKKETEPKANVVPRGVARANVSSSLQRAPWETPFDISTYSA